MLYNKETKAVKKAEDCLTCPYFDRVLKKCKGIGKICFEFDVKTNTVIDPITKLPIKLK